MALLSLLVTALTLMDTFYIAVSCFSLRLESTKGSYAQEWAKWEKKLRDTLSANAEHLNSIQVNIIIIIFYYYLHLKIEEWEGGFFLLLFSNFKICLSF